MKPMRGARTPRTNDPIRLVASLAAFFAVGAGAYACSDYDSHIFTGRLWEQSRNCVDDTSSMDVVDGVEPETPCAPMCLILPTYDGEGGTATYISSMCPPLPPAADTSQTDPRCGPALQAWDRNDTCEDGGGSTNPPDAAAAITTTTTPDAAPSAPIDSGMPADAGPG